MKSRQKKVLGSFAIIGLILLGILAGYAISFLLQVTDEEQVSTELVVSYPNNLVVTVASQINTAGLNENFLNVSMLNEGLAAEFELYVLMAFPSNITASDITLSAYAGIVLDNWNLVPAFSAEQYNLTAVHFKVPWYVSGNVLTSMSLHSDQTVPMATQFTKEFPLSSLTGTLMLVPLGSRCSWNSLPSGWVGIELSPFRQFAIDLIDVLEDDSQLGNSVKVNGKIIYFFTIGP